MYLYVKGYGKGLFCGSLRFECDCDTFYEIAIQLFRVLFDIEWVLVSNSEKSLFSFSRQKYINIVIYTL